MVCKQYELIVWKQDAYDIFLYRNSKQNKNISNTLFWSLAECDLLFMGYFDFLHNNYIIFQAILC